MKKPIMMIISLLALGNFLQVSEAAPAHVELGISLKDGSSFKGSPVMGKLAVKQRVVGPLNLDWQLLESIELGKGPNQALLKFANGDRLTAGIQVHSLRIDSVLGPLNVPYESISQLKVVVVNGPANALSANVALGKPVHGRDGASHGKGLAKHVTDGDPTTHAKPPGSSFDYRIDLQNGTNASYSIKRVIINWGRFGDEFKGVRLKGGEQWAPAAWPGEYVTQYALECRKTGKENWHTVHEFNGRPVNEQADGVEVIKRPTEEAGCSSESITILKDLDLQGVAELRIRAKGGHWIGLFELEAHGHQE